jgi:hypothetical protein
LRRKRKQWFSNLHTNAERQLEEIEAAKRELGAQAHIAGLNYTYYVQEFIGGISSIVLAAKTETIELQYQRNGGFDVEITDLINDIELSAGVLYEWVDSGQLYCPVEVVVETKPAPPKLAPDGRIHVPYQLLVFKRFRLDEADKRVAE